MVQVLYPAPLMLDVAMRLALANVMLVDITQAGFEMYLHVGADPFVFLP